VSSNATIAALAAACALGTAGCEATITPSAPVLAFEGGVVAPVTAVPPDIWVYPHVYYGGGYVYLVNGSWYQPTRSGWVVFRREPVELSRQRTRIYASPRVPRTPTYGYPPPASRPPPPPQEPYEYGRERTPNP
jgi:hypothetical protein